MNVKLMAVNGMNFNYYDFKLDEALYGYEEAVKKVMDKLKVFSGHMLGKCYTPNNYDEICLENVGNTFGRANFCIKNGHHSGFEHAKLTFEMNDVPKIIFMMLNNENVYSTSEQSARYTDFSKAVNTQKERDLYVKWCKIFEEKISSMCPNLDEKRVTKLAQENARYQISVATPSSMFHTIDLRQLNYVMRYFEKFCSEKWYTTEMEEAFAKMVNPLIEEFLEQLKPFKIEGMEPKPMSRLSFMGNSLSDTEIFSDEYAINYSLSFAAHAQNHRHRTIRYKIALPESPEFFIPPCIRDDEELTKQWLEDLLSVTDVFPQGMMVNVRERGMLEDFINKCYERICGCAQLEIEQLTYRNLLKMQYKLEALEENDALEYLNEYTNNCSPARCKFKDFKCKNPCEFGINQHARKV